MTGLEEKCRQREWKSRCSHGGRDGQLTMSVQPAHKHKVRCSVEVKISEDISGLLKQVLVKDSRAFCAFRTFHGILSHPETSRITPTALQTHYNSFNVRFTSVNEVLVMIRGMNRHPASAGKISIWFVLFGSL